MKKKLENNLPVSKMKKACKKAMSMTTNENTIFFGIKHKRKKTSMVKKNQRTRANCQKT